MNKLYVLLLFVPLAIGAELLHASPIVIFLLSCAAIIPLSGLLGNATEQLAGHAGATIGGLLNATLGNFAELVIAGFALRAGMVELVKASITGSIIGNLLLVLGAAQLAGGLRYKTQPVNRSLAGMSSTLLVWPSSDSCCRQFSRLSIPIRSASPRSACRPGSRGC